tara:strand:+ start:131 stop:418 length:288 start_codon:yes stop_codon:yes gene_type:complete
MPHKDKEEARLYKKLKRSWNREFVKRVKRLSCCVDCGEKDSIVLDFDHVRGEKVGSIADMGSSHSISSLKKEMRKCEVRCANCHRRRHFREKNSK